MLPICVRPERVWSKLSSIQGIRANLVHIVSLLVQYSSKKNKLERFDQFSTQKNDFESWFNVYMRVGCQSGLCHPKMDYTDSVGLNHKSLLTADWFTGTNQL